MPDIDLSKTLPAGPNILIDIKPLIKLNHSSMPKVESTVSPQPLFVCLLFFVHCCP
jgi:hypothetical protein